ncbi:polyprotein [Phytophthora megakarya]|uniref:Polyprotein n=1 Tax=Phytophthora megakarya TaxID=4795 RepID=A0A225WWC3_9STRA|nr:polyprotein [Phytophthora megakarya]
MNDASTTSGISLEHASFPHLSVIEWEALHHLAAASDDSVIKALLMTDTEEQLRLAAQEFMVRELANLRQRVSTSTQTKNKADIVNLDVSTYSGEGEGRLHLNRWFCEVDIAVEGRQISTDLARTWFLLYKLGGKVKKLALGKVVADASSFPTVESMKTDLRLAFETPQDESIQRSAFRPLKQGNMSTLEYIQRERHIVSCITSHPMDKATQVHVFISGVNASYQRFYLTRKSRSTLEEAFAVALREDCSVSASQAFDVSHPLLPASESGPEPMEVDAIEPYGERHMIVKYADGKPRHSATFSYEFDGFCGSNDLMVIELGGSFDCIFGIPWLARHQPHIDRLTKTVRPRDIDVNAVLASLSGMPDTWPHVAVMDPDSMTSAVHEEFDGPSCAV